MTVVTNSLQMLLFHSMKSVINVKFTDKQKLRKKNSNESQIQLGKIGT